MYLSKIVLDRFDRLTMKVLSDIYRLHQFVMSGFSRYENPSRVLFRVEPESKTNVGAVHLLVQSADKPQWNDREGVREAILDTETRELDIESLRELIGGTKYKFRLRANPVVKRNGRRYGLVRDEALVEWLKRKEKDIGAFFHSIMVVDEGYIEGIRRKGGKADKVQIKIARFEGVLEVIDSERFIRDALFKGIGPAKGFGCGLLSIARA